MMDLVSNIISTILLFGSALILLLMISFAKYRNGRFVNILSVVVLLGGLFIELYHLSTGKPAYVGHMITADPVTAISVILLFITGIITIIIIDSFREFMNEDGGESAILVLFGICGMQIMVLASELILILIGLEIASISLFVLSGRNSRSRLSIEGTIKYLVFSATFLGIALMGAAMIYGYMLSIGVKVDMLSLHNLGFIGRSINAGNISMLVAVLLIISVILLKLGVVPYHMWVPDFYEGSPSCVSGFASTSIKIASVIVIFNIFSKLFFTPLMADFHLVYRILEILTLLTIIIASVIAIHQTNAKRLIAYSSIANAGVIMLGILSYLSGQIESRTQIVTNVIFYLVVYSLMNLIVFGVFSRLEKRGGENQSIYSFNGLFYRSPFYAISLAVAVFSLAGLPPTAGFFAKLFIFKSAVDAGLISTSIIAILMTIISLYYYLSFLLVMFIHKPSVDNELNGSVTFNIVTGMATIFLIFAGLMPNAIIDLLHSIIK